MFPNESTGSGITFSTKSSAKQTFKSVSGDEKTKTYVFTVGKTDYTVKVSIAEQRNFNLGLTEKLENERKRKKKAAFASNREMPITP